MSEYVKVWTSFALSNRRSKGFCLLLSLKHESKQEKTKRVEVTFIRKKDTCFGLWTSLTRKQKLTVKINALHHLSCSYIYDEEIQPAPGIGEVRLKSIRNPLEKHLQHEHVGEHLICVLQNDLDDPTLLHVDVLKCLLTRRSMSPLGQMFSVS